MARNNKTNSTSKTANDSTAKVQAVQPEVNGFNPFEAFEAAQTGEKTRRLPYTDKLQTKAMELTTDLMRRSVQQPGTEVNPLAGLANAALKDWQPESLLAYLNAGLTADTLKQAADVLEGCPEDDLPKMLESQRSNRSKAKRGRKVTAYIASMVGELLIRERTGKAYNASGTKLATDHDMLAADQDLLVRRINSLASKKSRLNKLAQYDDNAKAELAAVEQELEELRALRPTKTKKAVKSVKIDDLKAGLATGSISAADLQALLDAMQAVNG